jgi:hypothetical protein
MSVTAQLQSRHETDSAGPKVEPLFPDTVGQITVSVCSYVQPRPGESKAECYSPCAPQAVTLRSMRTGKTGRFSTRVSPLAESTRMRPRARRTTCDGSGRSRSMSGRMPATSRADERRRWTRRRRISAQLARLDEAARELATGPCFSYIWRKPERE